MVGSRWVKTADQWKKIDRGSRWVAAQWKNNRGLKVKTAEKTRAQKSKVQVGEEGVSF